MKIKPKELCYCQSGKKYKDCHMLRDNYKPDKRLNYDKSKYINEWQNDSAYKKIESKGIKVKRIIRNRPAFSKEGLFINQYSEIEDFELTKVNIIQGDILHDTIINDYLKNKNLMPLPAGYWVHTNPLEIILTI